jgi:hypothetical protein
MKDFFKDILNIREIQGVLFFSIEGELLFKKFISPLLDEFDDRDWPSFFKNASNWPTIIRAFDKVYDAGLVFKKKKLYIKKIDNGYIIIIMGQSVPFMLVRLNCELIIPSLNSIKKSKGFARFFRRK